MPHAGATISCLYGQIGIKCYGYKSFKTANSYVSLEKIMKNVGQ